MRSLPKIVAAIVIGVAIITISYLVAYGVSYKIIANTTQWRLCVQQTSTYDSIADAAAAVEQYFPVVTDDSGAHHVTRTTFDDYRFVGGTTVVYGTHDCSWWEGSYVPDFEEYKVRLLTIYFTYWAAIVIIAIIVCSASTDADKK